MDNNYIKDSLYASVLSIVSNSNYYYHSAEGPQYSKLHAEGKIAILDIVGMFAYKMIDQEQKELTRRAKDLVLSELKNP